MGKNAPLTEQQKEQIINLYQNHSCVQIAKMVEGVTLNQVYDLRKRLGITQKQNPQFQLNDLQIQLLLGGKLGDGNFKTNGKVGCYYRESHAENELEYLTWKANVFGKDILSAKGVHPIRFQKRESAPNKNVYTILQPYLFSTKTSSVFNKYKDMSILETIDLMDYRGLIIYLLDDGWINYDKRNLRYGKGHFCIARDLLTDEEAQFVCNKFIKNGVKSAHIIGRGDISFYQSDTTKIFELASSFIPTNIDIMKKKFKSII